jgi:GTPase SAR1 family protein
VVEYGSRVIVAKGSQEQVKIQLWDTSSSEIFRGIVRSYYAGSAAIVLVYAVTDRQSFVGVQRWLADIRQHCSAADSGISKSVTLLLIGNMCDRKFQRAVSTDEVGQYYM